MYFIIINISDNILNKINHTIDCSLIKLTIDIIVHKFANNKNGNIIFTSLGVDKL